MNIYNIDGLPGVTVSGKQAGESEIILKTAKRGRMTFYSSNAYNVILIMKLIYNYLQMSLLEPVMLI